MKPASRARARLENWLHGQWSKKGLFSLVFSPLSLAFLAVSRYREKHATPERLPVPVVIVGNIYVGGTGKTPVTIAIARGLMKRGWKPGIISRGYGRKSDAVQLVTPDSRAASSGDEPLLIARKTAAPVAVGRDRVAAGRLLLKSFPDTDIIISDDGLQHYSLHRDVELCVVGAHGIGNGWVLPAGPLRAPPSRLDRVDAITLNTPDEILDTRTPRFASSPYLGECRNLATGETLPIDDLAERFEGKSFAAAAGIAVPGRFFAMLRGRGIACSPCVELGDHYDFRANPFADITADCILITEKDAVKCRQVPGIASDSRIWTVGYDIALEDYLLDFIDQKAREARHPNPSANGATHES